MSGEERDLILRVGSLFLAGEEAVTHDLAPLLVAIRREGGHTEDEFFLTTQLFEEAKHMEFFDRWFDEVVGEFDLASFLGESYAPIFFQVLPETLNRLLINSSAVAQVEASVVYHMIIEGVLAETGYHGFYQALKGRDLLPGLVQGLEYVQRDEARHIAFGVYFLQRHVRANPDLWDVIEDPHGRTAPGGAEHRRRCVHPVWRHHSLQPRRVRDGAVRQRSVWQTSACGRTSEAMNK